MSNEKVMDLWSHVNELRRRLLNAVISLIVTTLGSFMIAQYTIELLAQPIGGLDKLISIEVTESVGVFMRVSLLTGFILALPFILFQLISFISPGLYASEKKMLFIFIPIATLLFVGGVAFAFYIMLPTALQFLITGIFPIETQPRLSNYINFVTNLLFWIGVSFEIPLVVFALAKFRILSPKMLISQWRIAIVVIAIVAAVVTPTPDPVNMGILMLPLFAIYLLSIVFAKIAYREKIEEPDA